MSTLHLTEDSFTELAHLLPPTAHDLVKALGVGAALKLVQSLPGVQVLVPRECRPGTSAERRWNLLAGVVGASLMPELTRIYGGNLLEVPACTAAREEQRNRWMRRRFDTLTGDLHYSKAAAVTELGIDLALAGQPITYRAIERAIDQGDLTPEALAKRQADAADTNPQMPLFVAAGG